MEYQTTTLDNGLRIIHRASDSSVSYCGFMIDCGTRNEHPDSSLFGIAHFIEHILFKGTTHRNSWHINNRMESVGGELNAFTTKEETTFYAAFLPQDFTRACELLCDLICHATAPQHELEKEREVIIDEINSYRDTPSELIFDEFENRLFARHALGHNILGSEQSVRCFDSDMCRRFINQYYTPERTIFFSYGNTPWNKVIRTVERYYDRQSYCTDIQTLNSHPESNPAIASEDFSTNLSTCVENLLFAASTPSMPEIINYHTHQSHVVLGGRSYPIGSQKSASLALLNNILGGPGMNSRLNQTLREQRGLVYNVESTITTYTDQGYFSIYFGTDPHDVNRCLSLCLTQLRHLRDKTLTTRQLAAAQKQLKGQLGVSTANLENNAIAMAKNLLRFGKFDSLKETCARIDAVTPEMIQEVAAEVFADENLRCVVIQ